MSAEPDTPESAELSALGSEAVELLRGLIAFNTVNPPGNELPAQQHLHALLTDAGFECELLGAVPERPNLVARLRAERVAQPAAGGLAETGTRAGGACLPASVGPLVPDSPEGPTLCYLGHVDTVLADAAEWSRGPWSGSSPTAACGAGGRST